MGSPYRVRREQRRVTVTGDMQAAEEKARLTELVHAGPGVKDFVNAVEIKPKS